MKLGKNDLREELTLFFHAFGKHDQVEINAYGIILMRSKIDLKYIVKALHHFEDYVDDRRNFPATGRIKALAFRYRDDYLQKYREPDIIQKKTKLADKESFKKSMSEIKKTLNNTNYPLPLKKQPLFPLEKSQQRESPNQYNPKPLAGGNFSSVGQMLGL